MIRIVLSNAGAATLLQYALDHKLTGNKDTRISKALFELVRRARIEQEKETAIAIASKDEQ